MGLKEAFEKEALRLEEGADNFNESARLYEEAGITGIHPSASSLRESAKSWRLKAQELRKQAAEHS